MERKIGEEFFDFDTNLVVVENEKDKCFLIDSGEKYCFYFSIDEVECIDALCGLCSKRNRTDGKSVIFLKQNP